MELLLLLVPGLLTGAALAAAGVRILPAAGLPRAAALTWSLVAGAAALVTWTIFAIDMLWWTVLENGPVYYDFSAYMKYREGLSENVASAIAAGGCYGLLAGGLTLAVPVVARRRSEAVAVLMGMSACAAVALPAVVPSLLPRLEYGKDPVFHVSETGAYLDPGVPDAQSPGPTACFDYGVEDSDPGDDGLPKLCLRMLPSPEARRLVEGPDADPSLYDLEDELNETGAAPYDEVGPLEVDGVRVYRADWADRPPAG